MLDSVRGSTNEQIEENAALEEKGTHTFLIPQVDRGRMDGTVTHHHLQLHRFSVKQAIMLVRASLPACPTHEHDHGTPCDHWLAPWLAGRTP